MQITELKNNPRLILIFAGAALVAASLVILALIYFPLAKSQLNYYFSPKGEGVSVESKKNKLADKSKKVINPVDENFGLVIPKISANAKVIANVDATESKIYQRELTKGVAHAKSSALPNEKGNVFIFSHSGQDLLEANRYNAVFYLLGKLEAGDDIFLFYQGQKISYKVQEKRIVSAGDVKYMAKNSVGDTLTLMTCWPAGTTLKRLLVIAEKID